jgi:RNA polymerase sigma-70 factor (sigma-E family)
MTEVVVPIVSMRVRPAMAGPAGGRLDREGYGAVFRAHHASLLRLGYLLCGDWGRAEEAVAEAFARTWPHWSSGDVGDERAYLRRVLVNELRSRARRRLLEDRDLAWRRLQRGSAPKEAAEVLPERLRLMSALSQLPPRQRAVVVLRFYEDLSAEETAATLRVPVGTVKSQTSRGLDRLRAILGEEER